MDWEVIIMILKSLALKNFRIYKGSGDDGYERINFSSGDKNITIIQGNNEVGKTTMAYIIRNHDSNIFKEQKDLVTKAINFMNEKYGKNTFE